ncbi:hypothetical protein CTI12_AA213030 [Artemisia annua]|uniref:Zinc knuckle CX2CX4HX4C n=1 Tax=Artemisia annua TaxID=35608 RepID=A0A2U1NYK3_ARTAN|nr:hypothetical protein CTI12_AA213030 [Artemisia annua]
MDDMTARMCQYGKGRLGYARVLVEVDAKKEFKDNIVVQYMNALGSIIRTKIVRVEYTWKPPVCKHCGVFGHSFEQCNKRPRSTEEVNKLQIDNNVRQKDNDKMAKDNNQVNNNPQSRRSNPVGKGNMNANKNGMYNKSETFQNRVEYRPKQSHDQGKKAGMENVNKMKDKSQANSTKGKHTVNNSPSTSNQFDVLGSYEEGVGDDLNEEQRKEVNQFVDKKLQPTPSEQSKWPDKMIDYFNTRWRMIVECNKEEEDVLEDNSFEGRCMADNELEGEDGCLQPSS